jgi:Ni/Co efflux regulator RcnB
MKFPKHSALIALSMACALGAAAPVIAKTAAKPAAAAPAPTEQAAAPGNQANYGVKLGGFFTEEHKKAARQAFVQRYAKGKECPAGLERSGKGCAAPVQGRYWAVGQMLQKAVATHPVPEAVASRLPPPPNGYEYVSAGEDILLVSKSLHLVVDMIEDVTG